MKKYKYLACGGTFDHFHKGHEVFLEQALAFAETVLIGITSDDYLKEHKNDAHIEPYERRLQTVKAFLNKVTQKSSAYEIEKIESVYIPNRFQDYHIDALYVTEESRIGADIINKKRKKDGQDQLPIVLHPFTKAYDGGIISSRRIRNGEITREGEATIPEAFFESSFLLPVELRREIKKPFGPVSQSISIDELEGKFVITVGDVVTQYVRRNGFQQQIAVVDLKVQRKKTFRTISEHKESDQKVFSGNNTPGTLQKEIFTLVSEVCAYVQKGRNALIHVTGEEDLVALPLMLRAPLESILLYGQPQKGMVKVIITEEVKQNVISLLSRFKSDL